MENFSFSDFLGQLFVGLILAVLAGAGGLIVTIIGATWRFWSKLKLEMEKIEQKIDGFVSYAREKFAHYDEQFDRNDELHNRIETTIQENVSDHPKIHARITQAEKELAELKGQCDD